MTILRRVATLEAVLIQPRDDAGFKLALLKQGESREEGILRSGLKEWPADRILALRFVSTLASLPEINVKE